MEPIRTGLELRGGQEIDQGMIDLFRLRGPSRYTFESPGQPLPLVAPAFDYYAGLKAAVDASPVEALIERNFDGGLADHMRQLHARGYLGRRGGTVEPGAFTLQFRKLDVYYRWIPKNSCTAIKRTLVGFEDAERSESFSTHNFHAEVQDAYGPASAGVFSGMESAKAIAVVREPLERVVSCYLDKFSAPTVRERGFEGFAEGHLRRAQRMLGVREDLSRSISFAEFVWYLTQTPVAVWDPHWKPQWTYFGDDQDLDGYELFSMGDTAQIWSYLGVDHDNRRYNATAAGALDLSARTDDYSELLPAELQNVDQTQYQNFLPDALIRVLMPFFGRDYDIYNRAVAQGRSRRD